MNTLLITGGSGFVGKNLAEFFSRDWTVIQTYFQHPIASGSVPQSVFLDVRDTDSVLAILERARPRVVIHAAGNKDVKYCEYNPDQAYQINAIGTQNVARACRRVGARMIYLSTDLVFGGSRGDYQEDEVPKPALAYGLSKLQGERFALEELEDVAVCRSGGIYGKGSPLLGWLSTELVEKRQVECFVDVFNTPTYVENLAEMMDAIIRKRLSGIFHTAGAERVSRFDFFRSFAGTFGLDTNLLCPVSFNRLKEALWLQRDASLSVKQTSQRLGIAFNSVTEGFTRLKVRGGV